MYSGAPSRLVDDILGGKLDAFIHDLPELPELDNLFAPEVRGLSVGNCFVFLSACYMHGVRCAATKYTEAACVGATHN